MKHAATLDAFLYPILSILEHFRAVYGPLKSLLEILNAFMRVLGPWRAF